MQLPAWATQKLGPLPVWGWGALSLTGGAGYVLYQRRRRGAGAATLGADAQAVRAQYPRVSGEGGGAPGGFGDDRFFPGGSSGFFGGFDQFGQQSEQFEQPAAAEQLAPAYSGAPAVGISPSLLGGGYIASQGQLQNPVGSAAAAALASIDPRTGYQYYAPSLTDFSTEQPGGIQTIQAGLPGTEPGQGLTYSIYGTNTGTGPVVPASQRIAGERYDASGRVIA